MLNFGSKKRYKLVVYARGFAHMYVGYRGSLWPMWYSDILVFLRFFFYSSGEKRLGDDTKEIDDLIEAHSNKKRKKKKHVRN